MSDRLEEWEAVQREICAELGVHGVPVHPGEKVGIAANVRTGLMPINGMRVPPEGGVCGWYIWAGPDAPSADADFFLPLHAAHLPKWCPTAIGLLQLPPGWRFELDGDTYDAWFDQTLLEPPKKR
ncbi:MAG: immunity protein Imm33 domain-containing protein [Myxococcota bacterium]